MWSRAAHACVVCRPPRVGALRRLAPLGADAIHVVARVLGGHRPQTWRNRDFRHLAETHVELGVAQLDEDLSAPAPSDRSVQVMLIDGPAGIGKTKFIEMIALSRAQRYAQSGRPLLLHVQSRGRVLSYLQDLMAFSLQRLRLTVTFDQLPVLARHGLVTLAIDGFDELGDPNGYDLAWGQFNDTIAQVRGQSTVILAGRETFIGLERLKRALPALEQQDIVRSLTLQPPSTKGATRWLRRKGWPQRDVGEVSGLLDAGSYALRPFFLSPTRRARRGQETA